jgi:hypothetical protein
MRLLFSVRNSELPVDWLDWGHDLFHDRQTERAKHPIIVDVRIGLLTIIRINWGRTDCCPINS